MSEPLLPLREPLKPPADYPQSRVASHDEALSARRVEGLFLATGALQRGHFLLKSGRHGDRYLEKWALLQHPDAAAEVCALLAERALVVAQAAAVEIDLVAGPTTGCSLRMRSVDSLACAASLQKRCLVTRAQCDESFVADFRSHRVRES